MDIGVAVKLVAGLALLLGGAELLVHGASKLALRLGMAPLVIGLTIVAFGTSAPELAIGIDAALGGSPDIALGNVVGSNIANVLLILGLAAMARPLVVQRQLVWLDVPVMVLMSAVVVVLAYDNAIGRFEGGVLVLLGVAYTVVLLRLARRNGGASAKAEAAFGDAGSVAPAAAHGALPARAAAGPTGPAADVHASGSTGDDVDAGGSPPALPRGMARRNLALVAIGLVLLVVGARWLVQAAVGIAGALGVDDLVIGLTVVAVGTSLPEIATSLSAVRRGEGDMAVGNVVGSNIFNLLVVLGATAAVAPDGVAVSAAALRFDLPVMTAVAVACLPIFFTGHCIQRWEGALFFGYYVAYTAYLLLDASGHDALPAFSAAMMAFVVPLTVITLAIVTLRAWRHRHPAA
jgi:cation:H+ antiporter